MLEALALLLGIGYGIPSDKILVDSHAHFHRGNDASELVNIMFDKGVGIQAVCDYGAKIDVSWVYSYRDFRDQLRRSLGGEIKFSDDCATVIERNGKQLIITQGREVDTVYDEESRGFLRERHEIHLVIEGTCLDIPSGKTYETLEMAQELKGEVTVAHPFTVPARYIIYGHANEREKEHLKKIAEDYNTMFEGLNSTNALWMGRTNRLVREFARENSIPLVYNTDMHARQSMGLMRKQIGLAGTLIPRESIDLRQIRDGRDIILMKNLAIAKNGERYGHVMNPYLFGRVIVLEQLRSNFFN